MPSQLSDVERGYLRQPDEAHEGEGVYTSRLFDPLLCRPEGLMGKLKRTKWHKNEARIAMPFWHHLNMPHQCLPIPHVTREDKAWSGRTFRDILGANDS